MPEFIFIFFEGSLHTWTSEEVSSISNVLSPVLDLEMDSNFLGNEVTIKCEVTLKEKVNHRVSCM